MKLVGKCHVWTLKTIYKIMEYFILEVPRLGARLTAGTLVLMQSAENSHGLFSTPQKSKEFSRKSIDLSTKFC